LIESFSSVESTFLFLIYEHVFKNSFGILTVKGLRCFNDNSLHDKWPQDGVIVQAVTRQ